MADLAIHDLGYDRELDVIAARELNGGMNLGFLSGLYAGRNGSSLVPSFTQNVFVDYDETVIQLAPVNFNLVADNGSINSIGGGVNVTNVIGTSSIALLQGVES